MKVRKLIDKVRLFGWREVPWGLIVVVAIVLGIIAGGFWSAFEIYQRAHDGVLSR